MKSKNYHPIFSDYPTHMGGLYLLQSLKHKVLQTATLKKVPSIPAGNIGSSGNVTKGLPKAESMAVIRNQGESAFKLPKIRDRHNANLRHTNPPPPGSFSKDPSPKALERERHERNSFHDHSVSKKHHSIGEHQSQKKLDKVLNCSSLENEHEEEKVKKEEPTNTDDGMLDNEEIVNIKNAKSYKINELGETNDSFMESTVPVQKITHCLNVLGGNFTQQNLAEYNIESNMVIDQPFEYIRKTKALREVSLLILALVKYDLIIEEVKFINAMNVLLQSFEFVIQEDPTQKFANKFFDCLDSIVDFKIPALAQYCYLVLAFFNNMGDKVPQLPEKLRVHFLQRSFALISHIMMRLVELGDSDPGMVNQFLKIASTNPWVFFDRLLENNLGRDLVLNDRAVTENLANMINDIALCPLTLKEEEFGNVKKAVVFADHFGIIFSVLRHQDVRKKLSEFSRQELVDLNRAVEYFLFTIYQSLVEGLFNETVEEKLEIVSRMAQRAVANLGSNKQLDVENHFHSFFKIFTDKAFDMSSTKRMSFSIELAHLMKEIAFARKEVFIRTFKNNRKNLDSIVFAFNTASSSSGKKDYARQKDQFLKPVIDIVGLLRTP
jgi:hypothetical protein